MLRSTLLATLLLTFASAPASAGKFNKKLSIGDAAPEWKDLEGIDGQKHSLAEYKDKDVLVVLFTCNSCPAAADYEERILAFANAHTGGASKVGMVAINANTIPEDRLDKMKEKAAKKKFPFAYLYDPKQETAKAYGAKYTPEFFVLNKDRKVVYMGAMDDKNPPAAATVNFLEQAVTATLEGKSPPPETNGRGCFIRYVAKRDDD